MARQAGGVGGGECERLQHNLRGWWSHGLCIKKEGSWEKCTFFTDGGISGLQLVTEASCCIALGFGVLWLAVGSSSPSP